MENNENNIIHIFENEDGKIDYLYNEEIDTSTIIGVMEQIKIDLITMGSSDSEEEEVEQE